MAYASWSVIFGEQPTAAKWNILGTNDAAFNDGTGFQNGVLASALIKSEASTSYTPTWSSTGTQPAVGNGTLAGRYIKFGRFTWFHIALTLGTTSTQGTGSYRWTLPVTGGANQPIQSIIGSSYAEDLAVAGYFGFVQYLTTTTVLMTNLNAGIAAGTPVNWATGDLFRLTGTFEAAS